MCLDGHQAPPIPSRPIVRKPRPSQPAGFSFLGDAAHVLLRWQGSASYRLILACMLSGVSRDRPVIVGWSTAPRGQVIEESLGQLPKKLAAGPRVLARTESLRTQSGTKQGGPPHDHWAKLGQLRYTRSLYAFVVIALF
jgi:hypothetical protein